MSRHGAGRQCFVSFVSRIEGDLVNSFQAGSEKAYSEKLVECSVAVTHVSRASGTNASWQ